MKHLLALLVLITCLSLGANAQAYERGGRYHSIGLGGSQFYHLGDYYQFGSLPYYPYEPINTWYAPTTGQINYQLEFGVSKYVGVGLTTGIGGRGNRSYGYSEVNVPIGVIANFHFYQLIDDKVSKDIHADKLDIYVGANLGSGIAFRNSYYDNDIVAMVFGGVQTGIRYYVTEKLAVHLETGYGKSFINAGITLRPTR
ncbi:hypothetical protein BH09BAC1_BH09BAC1_25260 [soil metagenome]